MTVRELEHVIIDLDNVPESAKSILNPKALELVNLLHRHFDWQLLQVRKDEQFLVT